VTGDAAYNSVNMELMEIMADLSVSPVPSFALEPTFSTVCAINFVVFSGYYRPYVPLVLLKLSSTSVAVRARSYTRNTP